MDVDEPKSNDEKTSELISQLKDRLAQFSDEQINAVIREAKDEAVVEAKAIIKEAMFQSILERTLGQLELSKGIAEPARAAPPSTIQDAAEDDNQVRTEIKAIRKRIAENERLLNQAIAPPKKIKEEQAVPGAGAEEGWGCYVYGVVGSNDSQPIKGLPGEGIDPAYPVYVLSCEAGAEQKIQAIVSKVSLQEFGQESLKANLDDMQWLQAKVYAHQGVLETVLDGFTLIPMQFCTIFSNESRVQEMLAQHYDDLVGALAHLEGKQEWGVKAYCDGESLVQQVEEVSERVQELKAEMALKSGGAAYFMRKKLEEAVAEEVERISDEYAQHSHDRLSSHIQESVINPLQGKELTGRKEAMLLNSAYLVAEEHLAAFHAELQSLEADYGLLGFSYELTGPWPPYNFVTTNLSPEGLPSPAGGDVPKECIAHE